MKLYQPLLGGFVSLLILAAPGGCTITDGSLIDPAVKPDQNITISSSGTSPVIVTGVDGRAGPQAYQSGYWVNGLVTLPPGTHTIRVSFSVDSGYVYTHSRYPVEITFKGDPGNKYHVQDWPPRIINDTTGAQVPQQLRIVTQ